MEIILNILTIGLKPLYESHLLFYDIINDFREKLPRPQNQAHKPTEKELESNSILSNLSKSMQVIDLSTQKMSLTESDIDIFYNKLNNFDYKFIIFKNYYRHYIRNLNRFNPKAENTNFDLALITDLLKETKSRPLRPFPVLKYHLKYRYKLSSRIFKLMNRKK
tara:strand:+ start:126 stop:617 length:492 start_codon:yes stop_codon:yes gene_type:complete